MGLDRIVELDPTTSTLSSRLQYRMQNGRLFRTVPMVMARSSAERSPQRGHAGVLRELLQVDRGGFVPDSREPRQQKHDPVLESDILWIIHLRTSSHNSGG
jgi:hypothetical protein